LCLLWWAFTVDKKFITHMSNMPIDDPQPLPSSESQTENL
jgi:hypothetical protein